MKKILNTLLLTLAIIGMASCSDGEGDYAATNSIKIVSQTVSDMSVKASEGTIVVQAPSQFEAVSYSDWFTSSVSGNTITVKTTDNNNVEYRSGKVTIKCGYDVVDVAVIQEGTIISLDTRERELDDTKQTFQVPYSCNVDLTFSTSAPWISCKDEGGVLTITVEENNTGHMRNGYINYIAGNSNDRIIISQCDIEKDILGKMYLAFYDADSQGYKTFNAEFVKETDAEGATSFSIVLSKLGLSIPVSFDEATKTITLNAGQNTGKFQGYYIFTALYDAETGKMTTNDKFGMEGQFYYDNDKEATYLKFRNDGTWNEGTATSIVLYAFDAEGNAAGAIAMLHYPYLMK